ncbi:glycine-rich domain-containing protein [Streptomyces sp. NPDC001780]
MSITAEAPAARDARNLLTAKEFVAVAATVQRANPRLDQTTAGRVVTEGLKLVATAAARPGFPLAPSRVVDEGWHALILHTRIYTRLCKDLGGYVHHVPQSPDADRAPGVLAVTQTAITAAGFDVDQELWRPARDRSIRVAADCQHSPSSCEDHPCDAPTCDPSPN